MVRASRASPPPLSQRRFDLHASAAIDLLAQNGDEDKRGTFVINAYNGGAMRVRGFMRPVVIDLDGLRARQRTPVLLDHDDASIAGQATATTIRSRSVTLVGRLTGDLDNPDDPAGKIALHARNGFEWQTSVGVDVEQMELVDVDQTARANGRNFKGPLFIVRHGRLGEVSFVALGADEQSSARVAATGVITMTFEQWLQASGFEIDALGDKQTKRLRSMYERVCAAEEAEGADPDDDDGAGEDEDADDDGEDEAAPTPPDVEVAARRTRLAAESRRVDSIRSLCGATFGAIEADAIEKGWTVKQTKRAVVRAGRPKVPAIHSPETTPTSAVLECALMRAGGYRGDIEAQFDEETLDRSQRMYRSGLGLRGLIVEAAAMNGYQGRHWQNDKLRDVLHAAFGGGSVQAGFSTIDISGILSNIANKFILQGWLSVERVWREITAVRNVSDFKTVTSYRLTVAAQYNKVEPGGEIKHGTLGEQSYTNKADTYALMLSIDRQDIINDDLGALTEIPMHLGRGAALKVNDVFWTAFLDNSAFFATGNSNFFDGASSALGIDSLTTAEQKFMDQTDPDGYPIAVMPKILLVPTALKATAEQLEKSVELRDTTASTKFPVANPHAGKFPPKVSAYLGNSSYTGFSAAAWYLLADPMDVRVIETAFLNGQESPTVETSDADFNVLGIQMRGYHDFGVSKQEYRGGVKSKGEA